MSHLVDSFYQESQKKSPFRLASKKGFEKVNFVLNQSASYDHEGAKGKTNPVLLSKAENIIRDYQDKGTENKIKK